METPRNKMIKDLKKVVVPYLKEVGFTGNFPHFKRISKEYIDLIMFQFNRHGGSFLVEIAASSLEDFTLKRAKWGEINGKLELKDYTVGHIREEKRFRLGSTPGNVDSCWFYFDENTSGPDIYEEKAKEVITRYKEQAESFYSSHRT